MLKSIRHIPIPPTHKPEQMVDRRLSLCTFCCSLCQESDNKANSIVSEIQSHCKFCFDHRSVIYFGYGVWIPASITGFFKKQIKPGHWKITKVEL